MERTLQLCCELIRRQSVTPADDGCQAFMMQHLEALGFECTDLPFGDVSNFWATHGESGPLLVFAGHTDVVPPGPSESWDSPPFEPSLRGPYLYGRGSADMKGSLAAMLVACEHFIGRHPEHPGRVGFLITSDEEGPAKDGTVKVLEYLAARDERIDWCVVGEPGEAWRRHQERQARLPGCSADSAWNPGSHRLSTAGRQSDTPPAASVTRANL